MQARVFCGLAVAAALMAAAPPRVASAPSGTPAARIAWFGTWQAGQAEAKRAGRPILLIAAAPHCHNVSGIW
jgi:hypothetical protein